MGDDSEDLVGTCPNCGAYPVMVDELGEENGKVCCKYCYEKEREKASRPATQSNRG